jgi:inhibitor of cysteine peptidase
MSHNKSGIAALLIFLILATIPSALCTATPSIMNSNRVITDADNGKTINLNKGNEFSLKLTENPTTGYSWKITLSSGLKLIQDQYIPPVTAKKGAQGQHIWVIQAIKNGSQGVVGKYSRSNGVSISTFSLNIKVK